MKRRDCFWTAVVFFLLLGGRQERVQAKVQEVFSGPVLYSQEIKAEEVWETDIQKAETGENTARRGQNKTDEQEEQTKKQEEQSEEQKEKEQPSDDTEEADTAEEDAILALIQQELDLEAIQEALDQTQELEQLSFLETVKALLGGTLPFELEDLPQLAANLLLKEVRKQKDLAVKILAIVLSCTVFSSFLKVFENRQVAELSFYMMYLLISALLLQSFSVMSQMVEKTCKSAITFVELLLPSYLAAVVFCSGTVTALGAYEITMLGIWLLQNLILNLALPAVHFYLVLLLLNQMSGGDTFSHFASLMETAVIWLNKTVLGAVIGLQAVQCLVSPSVDALKSLAAQKLVKAIPGLGSMLDAAAQTVAGCALVLKNAVGAAGILMLAVLCAAPAVQVLACMLLYRLLGAVIQPVCEKRMADGIEGIAGAAALLLRILVSVTALFIILLAMITAGVRGGVSS